MKIRFSDLISKRERKKSISYKFNIDPFNFEGEMIKPVSEVEVEGLATSDDEIVIIKAHIKCDLELKCSRCLEAFIYPVDIDIEERFTMDMSLLDEDDELSFVKDDVLDISEVVESSIVSTLPIKRLCREDCKGLCEKCGKNLNEGKCGCDRTQVDSRLEILKQLMEDE